ncbi:hypothetical protein [Sphingobium sp. EM0848]|nr:hypothetical protein [Sphingobium sp. EM0848]
MREINSPDLERRRRSLLRIFYKRRIAELETRLPEIEPQCFLLS